MDNKNKQEENVETFSENKEKKEKKENKSSKIKRNIGRILRLIIPPFFPFLFSYVGKIVCLIPPLNDSFGVTATIFCAFVFVPIYCIIYGISVVKNEERKYHFALYNSIVPCLVFLLNAGLFIVLIFAWLLFWTMIPIWIYNYNHNPDN